MANVTTTKTIYELVLEISENKIISPTIPVDITIGEAGILHQNAIEDKAELLAKGVSEDSINELPLRAKFLQERQSIWTAVYQSALTSNKEWEAKINEASQLHRELKFDFKFAYRNHPDILKKLQNILRGRGHMNLIQDMSDYYAFAKQYPEPLAAILFDTTKIDRSKQLSHELHELMNRVNGVKNSKKRPEKQLRDRAYTYLKQLVDEIRAYGKYAFWDDKEKQKRYSSEYIRSKNKRNNKLTEINN
ncbi:hypothetical protein [Labilibaculum euxinus]